MKRLFSIFELTKNEQRVVLVVVLLLIAVAFIGYDRRIHRFSAQPTPVAKVKPSPSPVETADDQ